MKAFVKVNNGTFPNLNFYMAWEGFNTMGYSVTLFEEKDIPNLDITTETPVFAGVKVFQDVISKLGVYYSPFNCYPRVLTPYYGRTIHKSLLGAVRSKFHKDGVPVFVKPVQPKVFTGVVLNSILELIPIANVPDYTEVFYCEPLPPILSEYRAYIHDGDILGVKHYFGDWSVVPNRQFVEKVVEAYKPCPVAYGVDFAVCHVENQYEPLTIVLEANDGCNLGNYGIDSIHYGEMIVSRWFEIMTGAPKVQSGLNVDIGIPEVNLKLGPNPMYGRAGFIIGNHHIYRDDYWKLTDEERQALHDKHDPGSKAKEW